MAEVYLRITLVSLVALAFMLRFDPMRSWMRSALRRWHALLVSVLFWTSFFWPTTAVSSYSIGELGMGRLVRVVLLLAAAAYLLLHVGQSRRARLLDPLLHLPMALYVFWAAASASYSPEPLLTLWKAFEVGVIVLFGISLARMYADVEPYLEVLRGALFLLFVVAVFAAVGILLEPRLSLEIGALDAGLPGDLYSRWGIFPRINPNTLAQIGMVLAAAAMIEILRPSSGRKWPSYILAAVGLFCLFSAHSRTSLVSLVAASFIILYLFRRSGFLPIYLLAGAGALFVAYDSITEFVLRGQSAAQFSSLTGRTYIWELAWKSFLESPLWGHGYYAGHKDIDVSRVLSGSFSSVDNTYLEILVDLGVIGLGLACWYLIRIFRDLLVSFRGYRHLSVDQQTGWLQAVIIFVAIIVRSITGPTFQVFHLNTHLLILVACTLSALAWSARRGGCLRGYGRMQPARFGEP